MLKNKLKKKRHKIFNLNKIYCFEFSLYKGYGLSLVVIQSITLCKFKFD